MASTPLTDIRQAAQIAVGTIEDFPMIYENLIRQFPKTELYEYGDFLNLLHGGRYRILMYRNADGQLIGYALVFFPENSSVFWLDYLAITQPFQSHGYGQKLFQAVHQKYCGPYEGMILSVEQVDESDPAKAKRQKRRIEFYEKLGAYRLHANFLQPWEEGSFPMHLYYKPKTVPSNLGRTVQARAIAQMYAYCCASFPTSRNLLSKFQDTIVDEHFA